MQKCRPTSFLDEAGKLLKGLSESLGATLMEALKKCELTSNQFGFQKDKGTYDALSSHQHGTAGEWETLRVEGHLHLGRAKR